MIVNTAYPFMAKTKKLFTHLFEMVNPTILPILQRM